MSIRIIDPERLVRRLLFILAIFISSPANPESLATPEDPSADAAPAVTAPAGSPPGSASAGGSAETGAASTLAMSGAETAGVSQSGLGKTSIVSNSLFAGAATSSIPIEVPPGRGGMAPNLALTYNSQRSNGWVGVGWNLDMGAIQRSTKFGVNYTSNNFVASANGSSWELVARGDWGPNNYGAKIEGAFLKYYLNASTGGWEVTAKNGTKYYYGSTASSRQDNASVVFKWCLDKVQDLNGNYMTVSYEKDSGEIYLSRIDYTGNQSLPPANYVVFYRELRSDAPYMYVPNFSVKTQYRLKTIEVGASGQMVRAYKLLYASSGSTSRSILMNLQLYGNDAQIQLGTVQSGTMLPIFGASWEAAGTGFSTPSTLSMTINTGDPGWNMVGDYNGDGKVDLLMIQSGSAGYVNYATDNGFQTAGITGMHFNTASPGWNLVGDFNGDGKTDVLMIESGTAGYVNYATDNGFSNVHVTGLNFNAGYSGWNMVGDFNGDGKADVLMIQSGTAGYVNYATGSGFQTAGVTGMHFNTASPGWNLVGDFNGDGKADVLMIESGTAGYVNYATDNGFSNVHVTGLNFNAGDPGWNLVGDLNGDGKTDVLMIESGTSGYVNYATGSGFQTAGVTGMHFSMVSPGWNLVGDFNGDGKTDILMIESPTTGYVMYSTGNGFQSVWVTGININGSPSSGGSWNRAADFDGDGKADVLNLYTASIAVNNKSAASLDLMEHFQNGLGGTTSVEYTSSTNFRNTRLPFPVQIVKLVTANDNNGTLSPVLYTYSGGYYDPVERDFRGFEYVKQVNPDQTTAESWFLQDNVFKGMMSQRVVKDSTGNIYDNTTNSFQSTSPYTGCVFPFLRRTDGYLYDGTLTAKNVATWFEYDGYGNITRKYRYGDVSVPGDEKDERVEYVYDTMKWIVSQPSHTYLTDNAANVKAQTWFSYDPSNGNLLSKTDWLDNGVNPVTQFTYNSYGNRITAIDPRNNVTVIAYDNTYIYPTTVTNQHFGFSSSKTYDPRYGKPLTETDVNGNTTTYQYDVFGRPKKVINPYDNTSAEGTQSVYYENFGLGTGYQRIANHSTELSGTGNYIWQENYFDGFGRTITTRSEGPDGKVIVAGTIYDTMGRVSSTSLPYFEGLETPRWISYSYDPMGRVIQAANPDNTFVSRIYLLGTTTSIDANFHKREEDRDAYGQLVEVREYTGTSPAFTLYATTKYQYDILGNLVKVTDAAGDNTTISYDTLSRKKTMTDPDMGYWTYGYDANGNLISQTDAMGQTIAFSYDALNRVTLKDYPTGIDVVYTYDEAFSSNSKGRLTTVGDASGMTRFYYDKLGRITKTVKTVDGVDYTTESSYDALGRTTSVTYPDVGRETVSYTYDTGGNLLSVVGYATYSNYNALGQAGQVGYGNGDNTVYQYYPLNNRLYSMTTNSPTQGGLQNLSYAYDNVGNINAITDLLDGTRTQNFTYDDLNRLTQAQSTSYGTITHAFDPIGNITFNSQVGSYTYHPTKPHAVIQAGAYTYSYDANGNMASRLGKTLSYDYENRLASITGGGTTASFIYDFAGNRVKKVSQSVTTLYIGNLYECTSGVCTKHVFAGGNRIVSKVPTAIYYYHTDHLRSLSVVTDNTGAKVEEIYYFPFGGTRYHSGSVNVKYKYTGQEEDAETGLYFYGARYYDPVIGRFISADSVVPDPWNPQALNRFSYVLNNPLIYVDPTGNGNFFSDLVKPVKHFAKWYENHFKEILTAAAVVAVVIAMPEASPTMLASLDEGQITLTQGGFWGGLKAFFAQGKAILLATARYLETAAPFVVDAAPYAGAAGAAYGGYALAASTSMAPPNDLTRLIYAESAQQYKIQNAMEGVASVVRNRVLTEGWPDTYYGVIHQHGQFTSVGGTLWNEAGNPSVLRGGAATAYSRALTVATGIYNGTIADPTHGATFFHSGSRSRWFRSALEDERIEFTVRIGPFQFYKE